MKHLVIIPLLFASCATLNPFAAKKKTIKVQYKSPEVIKKRFEIRPGDDKSYIMLMDKQTNKVWTISYKEFKVLKQGYENWRIVENKKPVITEVIDEADRIIITFNYIDEDSGSVLSGKAIIKKEFIEQISNYDPYLATYSGIITVLLVIALL